MAKYFTDEEVKGLDPKLIDMLDRMRERAGIPIVITCGVRTKEHNDSLPGSVKDSEHLYGLAADLRCNDSTARFRMVEAAFYVGFRRIEIGTLHLHVGTDDSKPQDVLWLGTLA